MSENGDAGATGSVAVLDPCIICNDEPRAKRQCVCRFDDLDDGFPF